MSRRNRTPAFARPLALMVAGAVALSAGAGGASAGEGCVPAGRWAVPGEGAVRPVATGEMFAGLARRRVVLLGEQHDDADHHRWQLQTIAGLHALHPDMVIGLEMFPRRVQGALDAWVAGKLTPEQFLARSEWRRVWGMDPALYMPIFQFARMNRVPMVALNVDESLSRHVAERGLAAIPRDQREGVTDPAPAGDDYRDLLYEAYRQHPTLPGEKAPGDHGQGEKGPGEKKQGDTEQGGRPAGRDSPDFAHFVDAMLLWDRAMAQGIAERAGANPAAVMVGLMGQGHVKYGYGVARQLADLGVQGVSALLPWDAASDCAKMRPTVADAVFGIERAASAAGPQRHKPRLGVILDDEHGRVRIRAVMEGSVAAAAGLRRGDVIGTVAGRKVHTFAEVAEAVRRQPPGTWLPMGVRRGGKQVSIVARFPPESKR